MCVCMYDLLNRRGGGIPNKANIFTQVHALPPNPVKIINSIKVRYWLHFRIAFLRVQCNMQIAHIMCLSMQRLILISWSNDDRYRVPEFVPIYLGIVWSY